jgi:hypothetical protein
MNPCGVLCPPRTIPDWREDEYEMDDIYLFIYISIDIRYICMLGILPPF